MRRRRRSEQEWTAGIYMCMQAEMRRVHACNGEIDLIWDAVIRLAEWSLQDNNRSPRIISNLTFIQPPHMFHSHFKASI